MDKHKHVRLMQLDKHRAHFLYIFFDCEMVYSGGVFYWKDIPNDDTGKQDRHDQRWPLHTADGFIVEGELPPEPKTTGRKTKGKSQKEEILLLAERGIKPRAIAKKLGLNHQTVYNVINK